MKMLLILWAVALAECDKLDRTYLPPPGSVAAGGYTEDLNLPLEFSKHSYPSTSAPENNIRTIDSSLSSKYPNIALGIDRQGPTVTGPSNFFVNRPGTTVSNIYRNPVTTSSYDLTQASTVSPKIIDTTIGTVTTISPGFSSTVLYSDPKLSYDQYLIQQTVKPNKSPQIIPNLVTTKIVSNLPNEKNGQTSLDFPFGNSNLDDGDVQHLQQNPSLSHNLNKYASGQLNKIGIPDSQLANIHSIATNLTPNSLFETKFPGKKYDGSLDNTSEATVPTTSASYPDKHHNQETFETSTQHIPKNSNRIINANSQDIYGPIPTGSSSTSAPGQFFEGTSPTNVDIASYKNSAKPTSFTDNFSTSFQPQRLQAEGDRNAVIINSENILTPEGFAFSFDTSNGIHMDESGTAVNGVKAKGSYSFIGDDGKLYSVEYTADENGFLANGAHLPTSPPIPYAILRGIEQAKKNQLLGIIDDGSYDDAKYGHVRYQGLMDHIPQKQYNNLIANPPAVKEHKEHSKTTTYENVPPTSSAEGLDEIFTNYELGEKSDYPHNSKIIDKGSNIVENNKHLPTFNDGNQPIGNNLFTTEVESVRNKPIEETKNKLRGDVLVSSSRTDENFVPKIVQSSGLLNPSYNTNVQTEYNPNNINRDYYQGYEYIQPKNKFTEYDKNILQPSLSSTRINDESNPDDESHNDKMNANAFIDPYVPFNFRNQQPGKNSQMFKKSFNYPIKSSGNLDFGELQNGNIGENYPNTPPFYNMQSGQNGHLNNMGPKRVFSTLEPEYASTTIRPYQSSYTSTGNQRNDNPSSTLGTQYSVSKTPLPSETSSSFIPTTSTYSYYTTTPTISQVSSTLRPLITSERSNSVIASRPSGYTEKVPGQTDGFSISTIKPNSFGQRVVGRLGHQGRPNKTPGTPVGLSEDHKRRFGASTDPRPQNLGFSSRPEVVGSQPSTEKVIGGEFFGPQQTQRFDPKYGYYY